MLHNMLILLSLIKVTVREVRKIDFVPEDK